MNTFIWFTFNKRAEMLLQSMRSIAENVRADKRFCIVFDAFNTNEPVTDSCLDNVAEIRRKYGIECLIRTSNFDREFNLNGMECIKGMFNVYTEISENSTSIFKVDDDTIVFKDNYINRFLANNEFQTFGCRKYVYTKYDIDKLYGCFYGMKSPITNKMRREANHAANLEEYIEIITKPDQSLRDLPEDCVFSTIVKSLTSDYQRLWIPFVLGGGFFAGWQYKNKTYSNAYKYYDVISFGNRPLVKLNAGEDIDVVIAGVMKEALDEYLGTKP